MRSKLISALLPLSLLLASNASAVDRASLQEFLAKLRTSRAGIQTELKGNVDALIRQMDLAATTRDLDGLEHVSEKLVALGSECAPIVVDMLEPGSQSGDPQKLRAIYIVDVLLALHSPAITTRLIELAQAGSVEGRTNAIRVLAAAPDVERAAPVLLGIYRGAHGELRSVALAALAQMGGEQAIKVVAEALADGKPEIVEGALQALASSHNTSMAGRVLKLAASPVEAVRVLDGLLAYYRAVPEAVDKAHLAALLQIAGEFTAPVEQRQKVLSILPTFGDKFDNDSKKSLRQLAETPTRELRDSALVTLVLVGDKSARKELFADLDGQIERNKNWWNSYEARAELQYRIADYKEAVNDFKKAIALMADDIRARPGKSYSGLAKCYAVQGKLKEAATTLEKAPLSQKELADLGRDPAFEKMVDHPKYKDLFRPH